MTTPPRLDRARPRHAQPPVYLAVLLLALGWAWPLRATDPPLGPALHNGFTFESPIHPGETLRFPVELKQGEFLRVEVDQIGIDLEVWLDDDKGASIAHADGLSMVPIRDLTERLAARVAKTGAHVLRIHAFGSADEEPVPSARQRLRVSGPRAPSEEDLAYLRGASLLRDGSELYHRAQTSNKAENLEKAADTLGRATVIFRSLGDSEAMAYCILWSRAAQVEMHRGAWPSIAAELDEAAAILDRKRNLDFRQQLERALVYSALAREAYGEWEGARSRLDRAASLAQEVGDEKEKPSIYHALGNALGSVGLFAEAESALKESLRLTAASNPSGEEKEENLAATLLKLAEVYGDWGRYQDAFAYYGQAREHIGPGSANEGLLANNFGELIARLGDTRRALAQYDRAVNLLHRTGPLSDELVAINNAASRHRFLGETQRARELYERAVALSESIPERKALSLTNLAYLYVLDLNAPRKAVDLATVAVAAAGPSKSREAWARHARALGLRREGKLTEARQELERSLSLSRAIKEQILEAEVLLTLARVDRDEAKLDAARGHVRQSVELVEAMRAGVKFSSTLRASFLAFRQAQYEFYIDTLMALHRARPKGSYLDEAFNVSEATRARTLIESLATLPSSSQIGQPPEVRERLRDFSTRIGAAQVNRQMELAAAGPDSPRAGALLEEIDDLLFEYEAVANASRETAEPALPNPAGPLSLREIQNEVLGQDTLLLEYGLGKDRSYLWAVTPHEIRAFRLPAREVIEKVARRFYDLLTARNRHPADESQEGYVARTRRADRQARTTGGELARLLLQPIAHLLGKKSSTLLVVSDGALHYIPFACLPLPGSGKQLVERYRIVHLPSASALGALRQQFARRTVAPKTLALFADPTYRKKGEPLTPTSLPPLPWSGREGRSIAELVPSADRLIAEGARASRGLLEATDLTQFRFLHFATHGIVDSDRPELSSLVLSQYDEQGHSQDGYLRLVDIYSLHLNAELVTLSACRTAIGREIRGEGLIGLARGFMAAGAERVVASLWSVEDRATAELMPAFYRSILKDHLPVAEALRQAQLAMMRDPKKRSPYYWAAFTLQGEWR